MPCIIQIRVLPHLNCWEKLEMKSALAWNGKILTYKSRGLKWAIACTYGSLQNARAQQVEKS